VRFEPTAYRPQPPRVGLADSIALGQADVDFEPLPPPTPDRPWLPLWWAALAGLPLAVLAWGVLHWQIRREDPWLGLLRWGRRAGRPLQEGETTLEYGESLAAYVQAKHTKAQDISRTAAREMQSLSREVSAALYGPQFERPKLQQQVAARWERLREYLRRLR
jgi:hypothetical protein